MNKEAYFKLVIIVDAHFFDLCIAQRFGITYLCEAPFDDCRDTLRLQAGRKAATPTGAFTTLRTTGFDGSYMPNGL
jgi:hypothetical protein